MNRFKVTDIINATTIKVSPEWSSITADGQDISGDTIKITGLNVDDNNEKVKHRLLSFLLNKEIEPYNPKMINTPSAKIQCEIYLGQTNILYYFPELTNEYAMA